MNAKFKKLAIASAVTAALGVAGAAQANTALLFPYLNTTRGNFSFVTVWQDQGVDSASWQSHDPVTLHLQYGYKAGGAANTTGCLHTDYTVGMSYGAILQFEAGDQYLLPEDFGNVYGLQPSKASSMPMNTEGFLIIDDQTLYAAADTAPRLYGEALVFNVETNMALAYTAEAVWKKRPYTSDANHPGYVDPQLNSATGFADFSVLNRPAYSITDPTTGALALSGGNAIAAGDTNIVPGEFNTSWLPHQLVTATWYVLPVDTAALMTPPSGPPSGRGIQGVVDFQTAPHAGSGTYGNTGVMQQNEMYLSGTTTMPFTCFAKIQVADLNGAIQARNNPVWASLLVRDANAVNRHTSLVWKLNDIPTALGKYFQTLQKVSPRYINTNVINETTYQMTQSNP